MIPEGWVYICVSALNGLGISGSLGIIALSIVMQQDKLSITMTNIYLVGTKMREIALL